MNDNFLYYDHAILLKTYLSIPVPSRKRSGCYLQNIGAHHDTANLYHRRQASVVTIQEATFWFQAIYFRRIAVKRECIDRFPNTITTA